MSEPGVVVQGSRPSPELSVILQIGSQRKRAEMCLRSLIDQDAIGRMEILLLDYAAHDYPPVAGSEHPSVRRLAKDSFEPFGESRAQAVGVARGRIVGFIEDHCTAHPGWASATLLAHAHPWVGVGPEMDNGNPGVGTSDAVYLINFSRWLPPVKLGETDMIPGYNSSYVRERLLAYGDELAVLLRCDTLLQRRLAQDGGRIALAPGVRISHMNETDVLSILKGTFLWNRMFAATRSLVSPWSTPKKLLWLSLSPLIPWVRSLRLVWGVATTKRELLWRTVLALPVALASHSSAAAGQILGVVAGIGDVDVSFLRYEIGQDRRVASRHEDPWRA